MQCVLLALSRNDERASVSVIDDRVGKGDPLAWRLGRVVQPCNPSVRLAQKLVSGEEGTSVSIRSHPEQDQVEHGEPRRVLLGKESDELLLVLVRELVQVVEQRFVNGVNLLSGDRDVLEEGLVTGSEVGVFVVERDDTFVTEEYLPVDIQRRWQFGISRLLACGFARCHTAQ